MTELLTLHLDTLIAFVTGGGLLTVLTVRATKRQAEAKAMRAVQEVYQETIKDLREDKNLMKKDNEAFRQKVQVLQDEINKISLEVAALRKYRCTVIDCKLRVKD